MIYANKKEMYIFNMQIFKGWQEKIKNFFYASIKVHP